MSYSTTYRWKPLSPIQALKSTEPVAFESHESESRQKMLRKSNQVRWIGLKSVAFAFNATCQLLLKLLLLDAFYCSQNCFIAIASLFRSTWSRELSCRNSCASGMIMQMFVNLTAISGPRFESANANTSHWMISPCMSFLCGLKLRNCECFGKGNENEKNQ